MMNLTDMNHSIRWLEHKMCLVTDTLLAKTFLPVLQSYNIFDLCVVEDTLMEISTYYL
jgi:hypothetical protein